MYYNSFNKLKELINVHKPNFIILTGEARSYERLAFEVIGINEISNGPDNSGLVPKSKYIINDSYDGLFSTLDYNLFDKACSVYNIESKRSYSAGTFVCNALLYQTLNYLKTSNLDIKAGFIHIPDKKTLETTLVGNVLNIYINYLIK